MLDPGFQQIKKPMQDIPTCTCNAMLIMKRARDASTSMIYIIFSSSNTESSL